MAAATTSAGVGCAGSDDDELRHNFSEVVKVKDELSLSSSSSAQKKRKHRRWKPRRRKWKPYFKLSWREKSRLEDREGRRATRVRAARFAHGQPVAPYNTTQFLMEDHNLEEPDLKPVNGAPPSEERACKNDEEDREFITKEFGEIYDNIHAERLNAMSKVELIQEYLQMEDREELLLRQLSQVNGDVPNEEEMEAPVNGDLGAWKMGENEEKVRIFRDEIEKLLEQNEKLRAENRRLKGWN